MTGLSCFPFSSVSSILQILKAIFTTCYPRPLQPRTAAVFLLEPPRRFFSPAPERPDFAATSRLNSILYFLTGVTYESEVVRRRSGRTTQNRGAESRKEARKTPMDSPSAYSCRPELWRLPAVGYVVQATGSRRSTG